MNLTESANIGRRKMSRRRLATGAAASLGTIALLSALAVLLFGDAFLDGTGRRWLERAYGRAHPGSELRIGGLEYSSDVNRLVARSIRLESPVTVLEIDRLTLTDVDWVKLLRRSAVPEALLVGADLDATQIDLALKRSRCRIVCGRLRASARDSLLLAEGFELQTLAGDENYFAARQFRKTRYLLTMPEFRVLGLAYDEMLRGQSYRARSIRFLRPVLDAYVNRDKLSDPTHDRRLMVHEKLASMRRPLHVDGISVDDGTINYRDRVLAGDAPGVMTFGDIGLAVDGLANRAGDGDTIRLRAQCAFMDAGLLKLRMSMPVGSPDFSLRYSGSLGAMDATCLNAYLDESVRTRLTSGHVEEVTFDIQVTDGQADGRVTASYRDLEIAQLDKQSGEAGGLKNSVISFLANVFKIRSDNVPGDSGTMKAGKVDYSRDIGDTFLHYVWRALKTGILDIVCY